MELTKERLAQIYKEWEAAVDADPDEAIESSDNYYWAGAQSFSAFLEERLSAEHNHPSPDDRVNGCPACEARSIKPSRP
jgi:hypothetical protein